MAREQHKLLHPAENALAAALGEHVPVDVKGYCATPEDNLIASVTPELWATARADLAAGKGDELAHKFRAAQSSSALAVNAFAPLRGRVPLPGNIVIEGAMRLEQERSAWARGYWPTLDVIVEADAAPQRLFVESKCIEYLRKTSTPFSQEFVKHAQRDKRLDPEAVATFELVREDRYAFDPVDAPQLLKHFLAAKRVALETGCKVILLCVWWTPEQAHDDVFKDHSAQALKLAEALVDPDVTLLSMTYAELWSHWDRLGDGGLSNHVALLRERYSVRLS